MPAGWNTFLKLHNTVLSDNCRIHFVFQCLRWNERKIMFKYFPPASKKVSHIIVMHHHQYLLQNQRHQFPAAVTALHVALTVAPLCFLSSISIYISFRLGHISGETSGTNAVFRFFLCTSVPASSPFTWKQYNTFTWHKLKSAGQRSGSLRPNEKHIFNRRFPSLLKVSERLI